MNSTNHKIPCDVICSSESDESDCTLFFTARLSHQTLTYFKISEAENYEEKSLIQGSTIRFDEISNDLDPLVNQAFKTYKFSGGRSIRIFEDLHEVAYYDGQKEHKFRLSYNSYRSFPGPDSQPSGAYVFRPDNKTINGSILYSVPFYAKVFAGNNLVQISVKLSTLK